MTPPAGWYEDPDGVMRWWDGAQWTEHTQPPPAAPQQPGMPPAGQYGQPGGQYAGQQGPTHAAHPMQPAQQQPQQQWAAYGGGPGGKPPRKMNPALIFGIGGAALVVIVAAIVIVLVTRDDSSSSADDPLTPSASASTSSSASASPSPSESPTGPSSGDTGSSGSGKKGWPAELPTDAPHDYPRHDDVVGAPKDASVDDFCRAQKLILDLPDGDTNAYYAWFWYRIQVGTPSDMSDAAREGWMEDVSVDDDLKKKKFNAFENYEFNKCY